MKYYAVRNGRTMGIFTTWNECQNSVKGYSGAEFKSFSTKEDAEEYLGGNESDRFIEPLSTNMQNDDLETAIAYVDGSFDVKSFRYSYGCYILYNGQEYKLNGIGTDNTDDMLNMRNVAGEITGAMTAMRWCVDNDIKKLIIVHDYMGISAWANGSWEAKKESTRCYKNFCQNMQAKGLQITFKKVKGHTGDPGNEMADKLAKEALGIKK